MPLLDKPFAMFGHGTGPLLAFETTRLPQRNALGWPACPIVSARRAPHLADVDLPSPGSRAFPILALGGRDD